MWVSESKIKYDYGKVSNPKDSERIVSMGSQVEELMKMNKEKDERIMMLKSKADSMSRSMKENCVKIGELDSEGKKQQFTIDDLQRKLEVVRRKIRRLDEFKKNESDFCV
jgi:predicted RNase H-like nuclease (RuvC/YqgF family)